MTRKQKKNLTRLIISGVFMALGWVFGAEKLIGIAAFLAAYLVIGYDVLFSAFRNILRGQVFDEKFLMAIATVGALAIREWPEAAAVMFFFQLGELFESIAVGKSRKSIAALMDIRPDHAVVIRKDENGSETEETVSPEEVEIGEIIIIRPGERIPLDGEIIEGHTAVNTAALTGESLPADKAVGDKVLSGSVNISGLIRIKTESRYEESTVARILELVENSQEKKAKIESFITRFARYYTPVVVISAAVLALIPPLFFGSWMEWLERALVFLVVSCPCALVVSVPLSFFGGIGGASKKGILIKGANYLEMLSRVDTVVFDKTGTLTKGSFAVSHVAGDRDKLLEIAAHAEAYSTHPIAESIRKAYDGEIIREKIGEVQEIAGHGLSAVIDGKLYHVGNAKLMEKVGAAFDMAEESGSIVYVAEEKNCLGYIVIRDEIKEDAANTIKQLASIGIKKTVMLTGDNQKTAEEVAKEVGVDEVMAELLPADKVGKVEELLEKGCVAFVGDGINDAPVLTRADIGIAMGALGSDAAIESADVVLMDDKPANAATAIRIAKKTMRIVRENIVFALAVKAVILILGAMGVANMWIAVFGDVGVLVIAIMNAMRAMFIK
ncbi:MAG: cadmium-translocating P-type ATPase [Clostridiales bacterium]|nr:cadmium-translocating P-type ATPase [Clostridiales bacterium]